MEPSVQNEGISQDGADNIELAAKEVPRGEYQLETEEEESMAARIERLGRERPKAFDSLWAEAGFVLSVSMSQVLTVSKIAPSNLRTV